MNQFKFCALGIALSCIHLTTYAQTKDGPALTDTGITSAQCYSFGNNVLSSCTTPATKSVSIYQDGMIGRDVVYPSNTDGHRGLSYSLVNKPTGGTYALSECVYDKVTKLTWEGKTATGPRAGTNAYTNYDNPTKLQVQTSFTSPATAPTLAQIAAPNNSAAYVKYVNNIQLCGYSNWRLPTAYEAQSIMNYSVSLANQGTMLDLNWFVNSSYSAGASTIWTSESAQAFQNYTLGTTNLDGVTYYINYVYSGFIDLQVRSSYRALRLVRN